MEYYLMSSSEDNNQIENNVVKHGVWWNSNASTANDDFLKIHKGDKILFFSTRDRGFTYVADVSDEPIKAIELPNFEQLRDELKMTEDRVVIKVNSLKKINFKVTDETFSHLNKVGVFGNSTSDPKSYCQGYLQGTPRGFLSKNGQGKEAYDYILNNINFMPVKNPSRVELNSITLNEDWQLFTEALKQFAQKFTQHPYHYTYEREEMLQYFLLDKLIESFEDWESENAERKWRIDIEIPASKNESNIRKGGRGSNRPDNYFDLGIYADDVNDKLLSIAVEIKLLGTESIQGLIDQAMDQKDHTVIYDIKKLTIYIEGNQELKVKSGAVVIFTNILVKEHQQLLTKTFKKEGLLGEHIKMFVVGADGLLSL